MSKVLDYIAKVTRKAVPEDCEVCQICGRIVEEAEIHRVLLPSEGVEINVCDACSDTPPSSWKVRFVNLDGRREKIGK